VVTERAEPVRTCVGCRRRVAKSDLLRVTVEDTADGSRRVVPDPRGRMPGRGAHVHPDEECLALAERRRAFGRALRSDGPLDLSPVRERVARDRVAERADDNDERSMSQHR
jgi:predicted RNA-binding protein YlxR (DUF448 family)